MAKKNFVVGIGGTGARVIESMLFLSAAGYGPEELGVIIVDPDSGNGNLDRTLKLISEYQACRAKISELHQYGVPLFKTEIKTAPTPSWGVFEGDWKKNPDNTTLSNIIEYPKINNSDKNLAGLVDLLFTKEELDTKLTEGFRGHPSIGAVAIAQNPPYDSAWKILFDAIKDPNCQINDVGVFLIGSIFGGTGASGMPTFANPSILKKNPDASVGEKSKVVLGGALVLPYFSFASDPEKESKEKVFVKSDSFALATKAALRFYAEKGLAYDELYLIGDSLNQETGKFATGKGDQRNNPHYIEIVTSLAAFDFFQNNSYRTVTDEIKKTSYFLSGRSNRTVTWDDFPVTRNATNDSAAFDFKRTLITMTVLSYAYATYGMFVNDNPKDPEASAATWYRDTFKEKDRNTDKDPRTEANRKTLKLLEAFFLKYIDWIYLISTQDNVNLIKTDNLIKKSGNEEEEAQLYNWQSYPEKIGSLLKDSSQQQNMRNFIDKFLNLKTSEIADKDLKSAANIYLELFYKASEAFTKSNYPVK